jgi:capsular polysaccharide biosynthesis protein
LVEVLQSRGFTIVDPAELTFAEQVHLSGAAEMVVGSHGAALANLVFCSRGTSVVEIFSPGRVNVCYWALANQVGVDYHYALAESVTRKGQEPGAVLRIEKLLEALLKAEAGAPGKSENG